MRAMTQRTAFGRNLLAEQWAAAEFSALDSGDPDALLARLVDEALPVHPPSGPAGRIGVHLAG
jgi:hypothetical protein